MKNNKLISLVLALLVCFSLVVTVSAATDNQNLALVVEANTSTLVQGDTLKVSVMTNENPGFLCVNFQVKWDTSVLEFVKADKSASAYTVEYEEDFEVNYRDDFDAVYVMLGDAMNAFNKPSKAQKFTGDGKVVDLTFKIKANADINKKVWLESVSYISLEGIAIDIKDVSLHAHKSAKPATCTEAEVCADCGAQIAPAAGHKPGAAATCTTAQTCTVCAAELAAATGHKEVVDAAKPATCSATGLTEGKHCSACNEVIVKQDVVAKIPHKTEAIAAVKATCTAAGKTAGEKCSVCGEITKAQEPVAALGHDWNTSWVNTSSSGHWKTCKTCGEKKDSASHSMSGGVCTVCGYGCKHTGGTATCTEQAICTSCNKPYGELLAHTPGAPATCTQAQVCTVCNTVIAEKLDHELETVEAKAATCGAIGWDAYEKCKNCDYTTYKEIAATGVHTYGEWTVVTEATNKEAGEQTRTCSVCGNVESEIIPVVEGSAIPVLWIAVLLLLVAAVIVVIVLIKKKKN